MKLYHLVFAFVLGCVASMSFQSVHAQDYFAVLPGEVAAYDEDAAYLDEMMEFYFGDEYAFFGSDDYLAFEPEGASVQAAAALAAPRISSVVQEGAGRLKITFSTVSGATYYRAYVYNINTGTTSTQLGGSSSSPLYATGCAAGTNYAVVFAEQGTVKSPASSPYQYEVVNVPPPTGFQAWHSGVSIVNLQWDPWSALSGTPPVFNYKVYERVGSQWNFVKSVSGTSTNFTRPRGGTYYFAVTADHRSMESAKSTTLSVTIP